MASCWFCGSLLKGSVCHRCNKVAAYPSEPGFNRRDIALTEAVPRQVEVDGKTLQIYRVERVFAHDENSMVWVAGLLALTSKPDRVLRQIKRYGTTSAGTDRAAWAEGFLGSTKEALTRLEELTREEGVPLALLKVFGHTVQALDGLVFVNAIVEHLKLPRTIPPPPLDSRVITNIARQIGLGLVASARRGVLFIDVKLQNILAEGCRYCLPDLDSITCVGGFRHGMCTLDTAAPEALPDRDLPVRFRGIRLSERTDLYPFAVTVLQAAGMAPGSYPSAAGRLDSGCLALPDQMNPERFPRLPGELKPLLRRCLELNPDSRPDLDEIERELTALPLWEPELRPVPTSGCNPERSAGGVLRALFGGRARSAIQAAASRAGARRSAAAGAIRVMTLSPVPPADRAAPSRNME